MPGRPNFAPPDESVVFPDDVLEFAESVSNAPPVPDLDLLVTLPEGVPPAQAAGGLATAADAHEAAMEEGAQIPGLSDVFDLF